MSEAQRLMRTLLKGQGTSPWVMVTDKLRSYAAARAELMPGVMHRSHKGINNRAENPHLPVRRRERRMMRFKSARQCQRFVSVDGQIAHKSQRLRSLFAEVEDAAKMSARAPEHASRLDRIPTIQFAAIAIARGYGTVVLIGRII